MVARAMVTSNDLLREFENFRIFVIAYRSESRGIRTDRADKELNPSQTPSLSNVSTNELGIESGAAVTEDWSVDWFCMASCGFAANFAANGNELHKEMRGATQCQRS
jgi:hypothetical protein